MLRLLTLRALPVGTLLRPTATRTFSTSPRDLAVGEIVSVAGSAAAPYKVKRVDAAIVTCTCRGFGSAIGKRGIAGASCKHVRGVLGAAADAARLARNAAAAGAGGAAGAAAADKDPSIPARVALAEVWTPAMDPTGFLMSEKLDGMRALWDGARLWFRSGSAIAAPAFFTAALPRGTALDGELWLGRGRFQALISVVRQPAASDTAWREVRFAVFDAPGAPGGYAARMEAAAAALARGAAAAGPAAPALAAAHSFTLCAGAAELAAELARVEALGGEGLMLRRAEALWRGGRSSDLLKVKSAADDEALVLAHERGAGRLAGRLGALVCRTRGGATFKVGSGFTDAERALDAAPAVGSVVTFRFLGVTDDGIPRFPTFVRERPDVDAGEFG